VLELRAQQYADLRDQRLSGWRFATGLLRFQLICAVGAISNVNAAADLRFRGELVVAGLAAL